MESGDQELVHQFRFLKVYKDGRVEKVRWPPIKIPPSDDPITGVRSKDVVISTEPEISARLFLPETSDPNPNPSLPVILYVHGGGFSMESAFGAPYDSLVRTLSAKANAVAVSVEYRLAPEHPIPACYDDSWAALQWIASHAGRNGPEPWLNDYADLSRMFLAGDSAGGNIAHTLAFRVGTIGLPDGVRLVGAAMCHPYFGGVEEHDRMWMFLCPSNTGFDDPRMKPPVEDLGRLGCEKVLVFVAGKDDLYGPGQAYCERLKESEWKGRVELIENEERDHCFHMFDPTNEESVALVGKIISFVKEKEE